MSNIKDNIVQLRCGEDCGTAFYIKANLLLTANHNLLSADDTGQIIMISDSQEELLECKVCQQFDEYDVALIQVAGRKSTSILPLWAHHTKIGEKFSFFGYPVASGGNELKMDGIAYNCIANDTADLLLKCNTALGGHTYDGMSGSPVLKDGKVCGIVIEQTGQDVRIVSIKKISSALVSIGLDVPADKDVTSIPLSIQNDMSHSVPNFSVFSDIDKSLENKGHWHLLFGSPGCGKTTLCAAYSPDGWEVLGRYFFKIPNDAINSSERRSVRYFVDWLESVYDKFTETTQEEVKKTEEKIERIPTWMTEMGSLLSQHNRKGIIIIDGLDELQKDVPNIVNLLDAKLPDNMTILLSCTSKDILPSNVIAQLPDENCVEVTPLDMPQCELYISKNSGDLQVPYVLIQKIALKTGGHPLYMNYLCRYMSSQFDKDTKHKEVNHWIDTLPVIDGDIKTYYESVWQRIETDSNTMEIVNVLSQLRSQVTEDELALMLSGPCQMAFSRVIDRLRFLLKSQEGKTYEFYHNSFNLFVSEKTPEVVLKGVNNQISHFCEAHLEFSYALPNLLHHRLQGVDVKTAVQSCNQEWADNCAINDVSPDLILYDVRDSLDKAVSMGSLIEVARLMLLAQRIESRYDIYLANSAVQLAQIKINMKKPDAALRYLIRDGFLLIDEYDAVSILRLLNDKGFNVQAHSLSDALISKVRGKIEDKNSKSISFGTVLAFTEAIIESYKDDEKTGVQIILNFIDNLGKASASDDPKVSKGNIQSVDFLGKQTLGYMLCRKIQHGYIPHLDFTAQMKSEQFHVSVDQAELDLAPIMGYALYFYNSDEQTAQPHDNNGYLKTVADLERFLGNSTTPIPQELICCFFEALSEVSHQSELLKRIIQQHHQTLSLNSLRKDNGVDVDHKSVVAYNESMKYEGYLDEADNYPAVTPCHGQNWEKSLIMILGRLSYLRGHLLRKRADGKNIAQDYSNLIEVVNVISFSFLDRVHWERSYFISEEIFSTYIYGDLTVLYCDFFPEHRSDYMNHIMSRSEFQLSLYHEGYIKAMFTIISELVKRDGFQEEVHLLTDKIKDFVLYGELNRNERTSELLKITNFYALLHDFDCANTVYMEMLKTSMGPTWYKEDQLELMNTIDKFDLHYTAQQARHVAGLFDAASGEMTFQRYVQQQQDSFTGKLAQVSCLYDALEYYKFETLPPYQTVLHNAEDWDVDMPKKGYGYVLGANSLIEASAMKSVLQAVVSDPDVSPYLVFALSELYWDNTDNFRYADSYAHIHSLIFRRLGVNASIRDLVPEMADYFAFNHGPHSDEYLKSLFEKDISTDILQALNDALRLKGQNFTLPTAKEELAARRKKPKQSYDNMQDFLLSKRSTIVNSPMEYWRSLNKLLEEMPNGLMTDKSNLCDVVLYHFDLIIRPTQEHFDKYSFLKGSQSGNAENKNSLLISFLIWFMLHPDSKIEGRARHSLQWLSNHQESLVIEALCHETLHPMTIGMDTKVSELLLKIAEETNINTLQLVQRELSAPEYTNIDNFSVARNLFELADILKQRLNDSGLYDALASKFPVHCEDRADVMINSEDMLFVSNIVDKLNCLQVLGGNFARRYLDKLKEYQVSHRDWQIITADRYVQRSFFLNYNANMRHVSYMLDIINHCLYGQIDQRRMDAVYDAINYLA